MTATGPDSSGVVVSGGGQASAPPDTVRIDLAAESAAPTVQEALAAANTGVAAIRQMLLKSGVAADDLRTTQTSVHVDYSPSGEGPRGYVARLGLAVTVREVEAAGSVVSRALEAGGETARLDSLTFSHADASALLTAARDAAFADARAKAEQFAALAGRPLGAVTRVEEGRAPGGPIPVYRAAAAFGAADMAVDPGQQEVTAEVTVSWAWAD